MRRLAVACVALSMLRVETVMSTGPITPLDAIQGTSFVAIRAALDLVRSRIRDVSEHRIEVVRDDDRVVVLFRAGDGAPSGTPALIGVRPADRMELDEQGVSRFGSTTDASRLIDSIAGRNFLAAVAGVNAFAQRRTPELDQYKIEVLREGESLLVLFESRNQPPGVRGSVGMRPGFEVELDARDLRVLRANFAR